jgi:pilin isopeptide linkage protein
MKKFKKFLSMLLAATMVCGMSIMPVMAGDGEGEGNNTTPAETHITGQYGDANSDTALTEVPLTKLFVADEDATISEEVFKFTMESADVKEGAKVKENDSTSQSLYAGIDLGENYKTISIDINSTNCIKENLKTYSIDGTNGSNKLPGLREEEGTTVKGYLFTKSFDLTHVTFPNAGVYRYTVKEEGKTNKNSLIEYDTRTYTVDIYVNKNDRPVYMIVKDESDNKSDLVFENKSEYTQIEIKKTLVDKSNLVPDDTEFSFQIKVPVGGVAVNLTAEDTLNAYIKTDGQQTATNAIQVGGETDNDEGWVNFKLKDGQSLVIKGVPAGMIFDVRETSTEGYTVKNGFVNGSTTVANYKISSDSGWVTSDSFGTFVEFVNTKAEVTDTGIVQNVMPYVVIVLIAAAGCVVLLIAKKRRNAR